MADTYGGKVNCKHCGRMSPPTKNLNCFYCGKPLPGAGHAIADPRQLSGLGQTDKPRFVAQKGDRIHLLLLDNGTTLQVTAGTRFTIGRDPRSDLVVDSASVSRHHCEIDWEGPSKPVLREAKSKNGTYLNDQLVLRTAPQPLRSGDLVRIGGQVLVRYLAVEAMEEVEAERRDRAMEETTEFKPFVPGPRAAPAGTLTAAAAAVPVAGQEPEAAAPAGEAKVPLQGRIGAEIPPKAVLRHIHDNRFSGVLHIFDGTTRGEAHMEQGRCTVATWGDLTGREVLERFVTIREGSYRFVIDATAGEAGPLPGRGTFFDKGAPEVIAELEARAATGVLHVREGATEGHAVFVDGLWTQSRFGDLSGRQAQAVIAKLSRGEYVFVPDEGDDELTAEVVEDLPETAPEPRTPSRGTRAAGATPAGGNATGGAPPPWAPRRPTGAQPRPPTAPQRRPPPPPGGPESERRRRAPPPLPPRQP